MHDTFLVFLMLLAVGLLACMVMLLRWGFSGDSGESAVMSALGAAVLLAAAAFLLLVTAHAVGVSVPGLGW